MKSVVYWSPFLTKVATINAVINSAKSLQKYSKKYKPIIINATGEFEEYKNDLNKNKVEVYDLVKFNYFKYLPKLGLVKSRISYLIIFLISFFPLLFFILKKKPNIFISHLITSLPIIIFKILKNKTSHILRISGLPNLKGFRKIFWKNFSTNISFITCPTNHTIDDLLEQKIFDKQKISLLRDPVLNVREIFLKKNEKKNIIFNKENYNIICIGRLTKQKNFIFLINNFLEMLKIKENIRLYILGDGEQKKILQDLINQKKLKDKIIILGFENNVFSYLRESNLFILSSLWEDPGWVLIEAAFTNVLILSSNCDNGPKEFLNNGEGGYLFENNDSESFLKKFQELIKSENNLKSLKKINAKKTSKNYTLFKHYLEIEKVFDKILKKE